MKIAIIIPARYGSTRFPGKPLVPINGIPMLTRVYNIGTEAAKEFDNVTLLVTTENECIKAHCDEMGAECVITSEDCHTGSDRILEAANQTGQDFDIIIGLQGDAPFTPVSAIKALIQEFKNNPDNEVVTPVINLRWEELDSLKTQKLKTPFSGTTAIIDESGQARWFSKNIIPAIRKEEALRNENEFSPVFQHLGLYGFRKDILEKFVSLPQGHYEKLEGLEQLRLLENNIKIKAVKIEVDAGLAQAGIDSPEDVDRAEALLKIIEA